MLNTTGGEKEHISNAQIPEGFVVNEENLHAPNFLLKPSAHLIILNLIGAFQLDISVSRPCQQNHMTEDLLLARN